MYLYQNNSGRNFKHKEIYHSVYHLKTVNFLCQNLYLFQQPDFPIDFLYSVILSKSTQLQDQT